MKYYKNTEIAALFHVSEKAVRNWVEATQQGKLNLELFEKGGRPYIANTSKNMQVMEDLVSERKKFKNTRSYKVVTPKPEFYEHFSRQEITDIIRNMDLHSEIPIQYSYFNGGAEKWAEYIHRLMQENTPSTVRSTIKLLDQAKGFLDGLIEEGREVNIIDVGVGDGTPIKDFLKHFADKGVLNRYVGIDLSTDMMTIAERNIRLWFGEGVKIEGYKRDIAYELFQDLLVDGAYETEKAPLNIILFLGGTLSNLRLPDHTLQIINNSMGGDDILMYSLKIDTEASRRYFDFRTDGNDHKLGSQLRLLPDMLGIDESLYDVEQYFDDTQKSRFTRIKLRFDICINFKFDEVLKTLELRKGKTLLLWRVSHKNTLEVVNQFDQNGFDLLHASTADDKNFLLTISKIKTGQIT